jgi:hypothetical protein
MMGGWYGRTSVIVSDGLVILDGIQLVVKL